MVLWDDIAVNEDKSNGTRYQRTDAETATLWSISTIVHADKFRQATKVLRNPEYSLASQLIRDHSRSVNSWQENTKDDAHAAAWKEEHGDTPTYSDAEWRQWRYDPSSSWTWSTWLWQGCGQVIKPLEVLCCAMVAEQRSTVSSVDGKYKYAHAHLCRSCGNICSSVQFAQFASILLHCT